MDKQELLTRDKEDTSSMSSHSSFDRKHSQVFESPMERRNRLDTPKRTWCGRLSDQCLQQFIVVVWVLVFVVLLYPKRIWCGRSSHQCLQEFIVVVWVLVAAVLLYLIAMRTQVFEQISAGLTGVTTTASQTIRNRNLDFLRNNMELVAILAGPLTGLLILSCIWRADKKNKKKAKKVVKARTTKEKPNRQLSLIEEVSASKEWDVDIDFDERANARKAKSLRKQTPRPKELYSVSPVKESDMRKSKTARNKSKSKSRSPAKRGRSPSKGQRISKAKTM